MTGDLATFFGFSGEEVSLILDKAFDFELLF